MDQASGDAVNQSFCHVWDKLHCMDEPHCREQRTVLFLQRTENCSSFLWRTKNRSECSCRARRMVHFLQITKNCSECSASEQRIVLSVPGEDRKPFQVFLQRAENRSACSCIEQRGIVCVPAENREPCFHVFAFTVLLEPHHCGRGQGGGEEHGIWGRGGVPY